MEVPDRETQNYLLLQQGSKLPPRGRITDTGALKTPEEIKARRKSKKIAKKNRSANKSILGAHNLFVNQEEKFIYNEHYRLLKDMIVERKGELSFADEILLTDLCVARLRQFRKTRLESHFNRFMDRQCPQDPIGQTASLLKTLGLTSEKDKNANNTKELMMKLLGKEAEDIESAKELDYDEWSRMQNATEVEMTRFTPAEPVVYDTEIINVNPEPEQVKIS
jgi:hypothetical protein